MYLVLGCVVLIGGIFRFRWDLGGPPPAFRTKVIWWISFGAPLLWVGMDCLTDAHGGWFTTMTGAVPLASVERRGSSAAYKATRREVSITAGSRRLAHPSHRRGSVLELTSLSTGGPIPGAETPGGAVEQRTGGIFAWGHVLAHSTGCRGGSEPA